MRCARKLVSGEIDRRWAHIRIGGREVIERGVEIRYAEVDRGGGFRAEEYVCLGAIDSRSRRIGDATDDAADKRPHLQVLIVIVEDRKIGLQPPVGKSAFYARFVTPYE